VWTGPRGRSSVGSFLVCYWFEFGSFLVRFRFVPWFVSA
jgi:hypothetical protein